MPATIPSNAPLLTDEKAEAIGAILVRVQQLVESDALLLSGLPAAWQYLAEGLDMAEVPWSIERSDSRAVWRPAFRNGSSRKAARDGLTELLAAPRSRAAAARYLLTHFSGDALTRLKTRVLQYYNQSKNTRLPKPWWSTLPIPAPKDDVIVTFLESRKASGGINLVGETQRVASQIADYLMARLDAFVHAVPEAPTEGADVMTGRFFALNGKLSLSPLIIEKLRQRLIPIASVLVTSVSLAQQKSPHAVAAHVLKNIEGELLHDAHRELGVLQETLFGGLVMAGFPLLYWHDLAKGTRPTTELPNGRRQEFIESEAAAICAALRAIFQSTRDRLSSPETTQDENGRKGVIAEATRRAGRLAFQHISAIRLVAWAEACAGLVSHPLALEWTNIPGTDVQATADHFARCSKEITNLIHLITVRNFGLACTLHVNFVRAHESFAHPHESRDVAALVREELIKSIASYDYTTGLRFSTYAYNRIGMELRRRPYQERQLIKLSPEHTTAQPRLWQLANESSLPESDPNFLADLTARYNQAYGFSGRAALSVAQAEELLRVGRVASLAPKEDDEDGPSSGIQIADRAPSPVSDEVLKEVAVVVRATLDTFTPAEELALSVLLKATPPGEALSRFNCNYLSDIQGRVKRLVASRATGGAKGQAGLAGRRVRITPGQRNEKAVRTKLSEELGRREQRDSEPVS